MKSPVSYIFFGSSAFSICVLEELEKAGFLPEAVVTMEDAPKGRNLIVAPNEVKEWAQTRNIGALTPESLKDGAFTETLKGLNTDVFIVASYGKIIPEAVLSIPKHKTLNVHPSLLPIYRGALPVQSMILENEAHPGVTIMELDKEMDHGPIVVQKEIKPERWPLAEEDAKDFFGREGGTLLASILPDWISGKISPKPQNHAEATYTKKISKEDGLLDLSGDPLKNYLKVLAYHRWPKAYFFDDYNGKKIRVIVTEAAFDKNTKTLTLVNVIPEGKKEMSYADYLRGKKIA